MKVSQRFGVVLGACVALAGCDLKSIVEELGKKTDGGTQDSGPGSDCNMLANGAPVVTKTTNAGPPPAMTGGTIADGTYFLTRMDKWNGVVGENAHQETWLFAGGTVQVVTSNESDGATKRYAGTYSTSGNMISMSVTCPGSQTLNTTYTATATELTVMNDDDPNESHVYTKQ